MPGLLVLHGLFFSLCELPESVPCSILALARESENSSIDLI
jgi:hypothetical protein